MNNACPIKQCRVNKRESICTLVRFIMSQYIKTQSKGEVSDSEEGSRSSLLFERTLHWRQLRKKSYAKKMLSATQQTTSWEQTANCSRFKVKSNNMMVAKMNHPKSTQASMKVNLYSVNMTLQVTSGHGAAKASGRWSTHWTIFQSVWKRYANYHRWKRALAQLWSTLLQIRVRFIIQVQYLG